MLTFHIVEVLVQLFPDPCGPIASFAGDLFGILGCYFPIHFTHVSLMRTHHALLRPISSLYLSLCACLSVFIQYLPQQESQIWLCAFI